MPRWAEKTLTGWGRVHRATSMVARPERTNDLTRLLQESGDGSLLAHGAGRSYGDAALNGGGRSVLMTRLDRFLAFDPQDGLLVAEAGVTFADTIATFLPRGFLPPVMPGTGFATLGGGLANDVHGKNHHQAGSFGQHLEWFDLRLSDGEVRRVFPESPLFKATVGGVGLTHSPEVGCDPAVAGEGVDLVPHVAKKRQVRAVLNNSFGFGGTNASLVMRAVTD